MFVKKCIIKADIYTKVDYSIVTGRLIITAFNNHPNARYGATFSCGAVYYVLNFRVY